MTDKKPTPSKILDKAAEAGTSTDVLNESLVEANVKLEKLIEIAKAIDWKMWVYLKANNYID